MDTLSRRTPSLAATAAVVSPASSAPSPSPSSSASSASPSAKHAEETWWVNGAFVVFVHVITAAVLVLAPPKASWQTIAMSLVIWQLGMFGITAGYHRLWSHRAFSGSLPLRIFLAFWGTIAFQGSIKWWVLRHRLHHRYTDTEDDPYSSAKGFYFSHIGWIFEKPYYPRLKSIDASDLNADVVVRFQHKHYVALALICGFVLPTALGYMWGDAISAFFYAGYVTRVAIWHCTFCINSVAHYFGEREYADSSSARGNLICAILTNGEGHHNYHHEFPHDYRNGPDALDWDPTKWGIGFFSIFGLAYDLHTVSPAERAKARIRVIENRIRKERALLDYGPDPAKLPLMSLAEIKRLTAEQGKNLLVLDGFVLDVTSFMTEHPGGSKLLKAYGSGRDSSAAFHGGVNIHTQSAIALAAMMRIARLSEAAREE